MSGIKWTWKMLVIFLFLAVLFSATPAAAMEPPEPVEGEGAVLYELGSGKYLYEQNADRRLYPASTTKIMTALLFLENTGLDEIVTVGEEIELIGKDSSIAGLQKGDQLSAAELLWAMLLPSGNDAAYTAAVHTARLKGGAPALPAGAAVAGFAGMMNEKARSLGATGTHFVTPDGYHHPDHYTTARDLALISREALRHDFIRTVVATPVHEASYLNSAGEAVAQTWQNTNLLLHRHQPQYYPAATGIKTGYTSEAGYNLVAAAEGGGLSLVAVLLPRTAEARWKDAANLFDFALENYRFQTIVAAGERLLTTALTNQAAGEPDTLPVIAAAGYHDLFSIEEIAAIEKIISWNSPRVSETGTEIVLKAPLQAGEVLGAVSYRLKGETLFETELLAGGSVKARFPREFAAWAVPLLLLLLIPPFFRIRRIRKTRGRARRRF